MLARALEPQQGAEPAVTVAAVRETVTYTLPVSEAALPKSLLDAAMRIADGTATTAARATDLAEPATKIQSPPMLAVSASAEVIALPAAEAERTARQERDDWDAAHAAGWQAEQAEALAPAVAQDMDRDDPRSMALRLRPEKREG
jgi:hypothetical protein